MKAPGKVRELLAQYAHTAWSEWTVYQFSKCKLNDDGSMTIPTSLVERWSRQMNTEYVNLPENEKESDRQEADRYWKAVVECLAWPPDKEGPKDIV